MKCVGGCFAPVEFEVESSSSSSSVECSNKCRRPSTSSHKLVQNSLLRYGVPVSCFLTKAAYFSSTRFCASALEISPEMDVKFVISDVRLDGELFSSWPTFIVSKAPILL